MKYAVIGLGAVGSIVGGLLTKSGEDIILIGKQYQIDTIKQKGIKILGMNHHVRAIKTSDDLSTIRNADVVFVSVKSQDTENLANELKKYLSKQAAVVSLQNGINNGEKINKITGNQVLSAVIMFNAIYEKPGEVNLALKGDIILENGENSKIIANSLNKAGIKTILTDNIKGYLWSKLLLNLQIAVTALTGQTIKESIIDNDSRIILVETMKEGLDILDKLGIQLEKLPKADPCRIIKRLSSSNSIVLSIGSRFIGVKEKAKNSMWQSLSRGQPTEIDFINGEIVKIAKENNLQAPINKKLVELVKKAEKDHQIKSFETSELRKILGV